MFDRGAPSYTAGPQRPQWSRRRHGHAAAGVGTLGTGEKERWGIAVVPSQVADYPDPNIDPQVDQAYFAPHPPVSSTILTMMYPRQAYFIDCP